MHVDDAIRFRRTTMVVDADRILERSLIEELCELATWAPNHKRTWPWRFASITAGARLRLGAVIADAMDAHGDDSTKVAKARTKYARTPNILVIGSVPGDTSERSAENRDAVAAAAQNLMLAATARGIATYWGSCPKGAHEAVARFVGFEPGTHIAGIFYLGWARDTPDAPARPPARVIHID
ncbi:MAG: hypothetical protein B7C54_11470 [Acidimicrobiales bacterium mtb01]|nr:hypothetical protein [Actinomycetota bacterium]TEX45666.1 MAG: hypothetical protein B7C54_11470 [Acidimicrobiales bacterium mtb01]